MQHRIPIEALGPHGSAMADAVTACVHGGFCLPSCPTYQELGQEMDSPRGRIYLMKGVLEDLHISRIPCSPLYARSDQDEPCGHAGALP
jgi:hypothetical protein